MRQNQQSIKVVDRISVADTRSDRKVTSTGKRFRPSGSQSRVRVCVRKDCEKKTREGKPFCPDHNSELPYVQEIMQELAAKEAIDAKVARGGAKAASLEDLTAQEILLQLRTNGGRTKERLVRDIGVDLKVLDGYIGLLKREKLVVLGKTKRGAVTVCLAEDEAD